MTTVVDDVRCHRTESGGGCYESAVAAVVVAAADDGGGGKLVGHCSWTWLDEDYRDDGDDVGVIVNFVVWAFEGRVRVEQL
jgi:hypothetical protein